jgi:hypothetical protein
MPPELSMQWIVEHLSAWTPWDQRNQTPGTERHGICGVYVLAHYPPALLPATVNPLDNTVICIGESTARNAGLKYRLSQFHRTAFDRGRDHGPAITYRGLGIADQNILYVSTLPVEPYGSEGESVLRACTFALAAERFLLWQYVEQNGRLPSANSK